MENSIKALGKLRDSIINKRMTEKQLRVLMNKLKEDYGEDVFMPFDLNSIRQYVYSKAYYERLIQLAKNGACSQEFYIHLLRVKKEIKRQIPNLLTLSRGLAPIVIIPAILFNKLYFVIILLIIFALTDFLDGKIARKSNLVSEFGVKLDAVCDKIFAISSIINHGIFIFNFVMEIAISYTNLLSYTKGNNPRSTIIGKIKTALLSLTLILAYIPNMNNLVIFIFSLITIICQVITLIKYINTDMEMDKNKKSSS